jgi:hypothetical protein
MGSRYDILRAADDKKPANSKAAYMGVVLRSKPLAVVSSSFEFEHSLSITGRTQAWDPTLLAFDFDYHWHYCLCRLHQLPVVCSERQHRLKKHRSCGLDNQINRGCRDGAQDFDYYPGGYRMLYARQHPA